eukprot:m.205319 g.205319  ORF g.205319 m.205319 type:complete len:282 (+) comp15408_c0_seq1:153-998(+)
MGCKSSKNNDPSVDVNESTDKAANVPQQESSRPMIFALMRNAHEVIRGLARDCGECLASGDIEGFKSTYEKMSKWEGMHANMEDGMDGVAKGFFAILNEKFDGLADKEGLTSAHTELHELNDKLMVCLNNNGELADVKVAFEALQAHNEPHLKHEEKIMMPKVMELKKSGENLKERMCKDILPCARAGDFEFWVTTAMQVLEKHAEGQPRARVFAHALWGCATDSEWAEWQPWIEAGLSKDLYTQIAPLIARNLPLPTQPEPVLVDGIAVRTSSYTSAVTY